MDKYFRICCCKKSFLKKFERKFLVEGSGSGKDYLQRGKFQRGYVFANIRKYIEVFKQAF